MIIEVNLSPFKICQQLVDIHSREAAFDANAGLENAAYVLGNTLGDGDKRRAVAECFEVGGNASARQANIVFQAGIAVDKLGKDQTIDVKLAAGSQRVG